MEIPTTPSRKIIVTDLKEFLGLKNLLESRKIPFWWKSSGSVNSIIYDGKEWQSVDLKETGGKGHHLNRIFKKDIDAWLEKNGATMPRYDHDYKEQLFNLGAIERAIGEPLVMIDINDCYWRTTFMLRYLTDVTYIKGKKKDAWKTGRNACIGSLRKSEVYVPNEDGKPVYSKKIHVPSPIKYQNIRNHIIGYVYRLFFKLYEELGDNFFMFLTDSVVTSYKNKAFVEKYFADLGYKTKSKPIEFISVNRAKKTIYWHDFTANKKDGPGKGRKKYYIYANNQLIDGVSEASILANEHRIYKK